MSQQILEEVLIMLVDKVQNHMGWDFPKTLLWFRTSNPLLGNCSPNDLMIKGRIRKLEKFIENCIDENEVKEEVSSVDTTKTCGNCWNLTGPTGLQGLAVRNWECSFCGEVHDRDTNSACVILKSGLGYSLQRENKTV